MPASPCRTLVGASPLGRLGVREQKTEPWNVSDWANMRNHQDAMTAPSKITLVRG